MLELGKLYELLEGLKEVEEGVLTHPLKTRLIAEAQIKTDKLDAAAGGGPRHLRAGDQAAAQQHGHSCAAGKKTA